MTDVYFVGNISKRLVCLKQLGQGTALYAVKDSHRIHNLSTEYFSYKRTGTDGEEKFRSVQNNSISSFFLQISLISLEGISVTPFKGQTQLSFVYPSLSLVSDSGRVFKADTGPFKGHQCRPVHCCRNCRDTRTPSGVSR